MDFQKLLLAAGRELRNSEVKALAFLCTDLLGRSLTSVESANDFFNYLVDQDFLSAERPHLLTELLLIIQRPRLIRDLGLSDQTSASLSHICSYRKMLYNLSEELTEEDLKNMKFLLSGKIARKKLEEIVTTLEVFMAMEHMELLSNTDLSLLVTLVEQCCPVLIAKIHQFSAEQETVPCSRPVAQESGRVRSLSCGNNQGSQSLDPERSFLGESPALQPLIKSTMNNSITSVDFPNVHGGELEALSQGVRRLNTQKISTASLKEQRDAVVLQQAEVHVNSFEKQATNTKDENSYSMSNTKRGVCLIVNNYDFTLSNKGLPKREGTMIDEESLCKVFTWLGFEVQVQKDQKKHEMLTVFQELGKRDHSEMDCVVCCVLSHGNEGGVYGVDGVSIDIKELKKPLNGENCLSLLDKPKLFFIQACQGTKQQKPVFIETDGPETTNVSSDAVKTRESIPFDADFVLAMATVPSYVSYRERKYGTWFIQSLCQNLVEMVPKHVDLVSILTKVNADVSQKTDNMGEKKQMPQPAFTTRKKVIFPNPQAAPPKL